MEYIVIDSDRTLIPFFINSLNCEEKEINVIETLNKSVTEILIEYLDVINRINDKELINIENCPRLILVAESKREKNSKEKIGLEILKHIRITEEFKDYQSMPALVLHWLPIDYYLKQNVDNIILFSPNTQFLRLPVFEGKQKIEWLQQPLIDIKNHKEYYNEFIIFGGIDSSKSKHDFRNDFGIKALNSQLNSEEISMYQEPLWLKKHRFLNSDRYNLELKYNSDFLELFYNNIQINNIKILWVDDDAAKWENTIRKILNTCKVGSNYELNICKTNKEASDFLLSNDIQLAILDVRIKEDEDENDINSLSGVKRLNQINSSNKNISTLFFTASINSEISELVSYKKADAFLSKGVNSLPEIVETINLLTVKSILYNMLPSSYTRFNLLTKKSFNTSNIENKKITEIFQFVIEDIFLSIKKGVTMNKYLSVFTKLVFLIDYKFLFDNRENNDFYILRNIFLKEDCYEEIASLREIRRKRNDAVHKYLETDLKPSDLFNSMLEAALLVINLYED